MRLFGFSLSRNTPAQEAKQSATGAALVLNPGQPTWTPRDYLSFAREAYGQNVIASRCIQSISDAVSSVRWVVKNGEDEVEDGPLVRLLDRPNPGQSFSEYAEAVVGYRLIAGNSYEERLDVRGEPKELYALRPDRMRVVPGADGFPVRYEYKLNGKTVRWQVDPARDDNPIWHARTFNPTNDWYGMSPVEAAAYSIDVHTQAMAFVKALLDNSATPSGAMVMEGQTSDDQFARLKEEIDRQYSGAKNAGRPMLLEGGMMWQGMGMTPDAMNLIDTKHAAARDICLAFGVPPMLIGIPGDNTYANYKEARLAFWEDTVLPIINRLAQDWTQWLAVPFGHVIEADLDHIPAIVDKRETLWNMVEGSASLTINEKRQAMGYPPVNGGDQLLVAMGQVPLESADPGLEDLPDQRQADAEKAYGKIVALK